jgi:hypothetical protein
MEPTMSLEKEHEKQPTITEIAPIGYGNPESAISYDKQIASGELSQEVDTFAGELMLSGELLVPVANTDDGCIDGRPTESLLLNGIEKGADNHNHERAKVAGGGYITATAMRLGVGLKGETIDADILETGAVLTSKEMYCGAHTGAHKHGDGTDCGANDRMLEIINNASKFEQQVEGTTKALLGVAGLEFKPELFDQVLENWQTVAEDSGYFDGSTGVSRLEAAQAVVQTAEEQKQSAQPLGVVKHLAGSHKEDYLVVNYVEGQTVSQVALKDALAEKFPETPFENLAQSFVVDAWRIVELAQASVEADDVEAAIYAGVMYQVATAATLTDGTLRTFIAK